jgi:two-component system KDP operon response regulator KdpE
LVDPAPSLRVVVVHRDAALRARLAAVLAARGHAVSTAPLVDRQVQRAGVVVIEHTMLPCATRGRQLALVPGRAEGPILAAFAAGADDVLAGPSRPSELASRVTAVARGAAGPGLRIGPVAIDTIRRRVVLAGRPIDLTPHEFDLLAHLATAPGRVFTKQELLGAIWCAPPGSQTRRLDTQVARLRRRLGDHRALLVTVWGVGYRLGG